MLEWVLCRCLISAPGEAWMDTSYGQRPNLKLGYLWFQHPGFVFVNWMKEFLPLLKDSGNTVCQEPEDVGRWLSQGKDRGVSRGGVRAGTRIWDDGNMKGSHAEVTSLFVHSRAIHPPMHSFTLSLLLHLVWDTCYVQPLLEEQTNLCTNKILHLEGYGRKMVSK